MAKQGIAALLLLLVAGTTRTLLQVGAMPPYAGLDELYHVARITFVAQERRDPTPEELSVPLYLQRSLALESDAMLSFAQAAENWPRLESRKLPSAVALAESERRTYILPNYEAQQPALYYHVAAAAVRGLRDDPLRTLRRLRLLSLVFAVASLVAVGWIGYHLFGIAGIVASSVLIFLPTWHTLLIRAGNDALAYLFLSVGIALSIRGSRRWVAIALEAVAWAGAMAVKLYTWPVAAVLPLLWWRQKAPRRRALCVLLVSVASAAATMWELHQRTGTSLGLSVFNEAQAEDSPSDIHYLEMLKITIASGIWMSGQHNNALTLRGMALYVIFPLVLAFLVLIRPPSDSSMRYLLLVCLAAVCAFAIGQVVHALAHVRAAQAAGISLPHAGKEGWYWYVLTPLLVPIAGGYLFDELRRALGVLLVAWFLAWDVAITEGALFRDYAGLSSPDAPSALFRWGPAPVLDLSASEHLAGIAVGPGTEVLLPLRIMTIVGVALLLTLYARSRREMFRSHARLPNWTRSPRD